MLYRPANGTHRTANIFQISHKNLDPFQIGGNFVAYSSNVCYQSEIIFPKNEMSHNFTKYCKCDPFRSHFFQLQKFHMNTFIRHTYLSLLTIAIKKDSLKQILLFLQNPQWKKKRSKRMEKISLLRVYHYMRFESRWKDKEKSN